MNDQIIEALRRTRYRVLSHDEDLEEVYRLRHECYLKEQSIVPNKRGIMSDPFDETENCIHVAVDFDDELKASMRLHLVSSRSSKSPTLEVFPELQEFLDHEKTMLDPTRLVVSMSARQERIPLHFLTLRIPVLATLFYDIDMVLAPVRPEHAAFYRRYLGHELAYPPRSYPGLKKPVQLLVSKREQREAILARTPAFGPVEDIPTANIQFPDMSKVYAPSKDGRSDAA